MRESGKLTARQVATLRKPGRYGDGGGLWLQITCAFDGSRRVTKSWLFWFTSPNGRTRQMGLGAADTFTLADARERARQARKLVADGIDPIEARRQQRMAAKLDTARAISFRQAAEKYIGSHKAGWKNAKHAKQWPTTLEAYAYPIIGALPVAAFDTALTLKVLEPIWTKKPETAKRTRGRIEAILDWAAARGYRNGENPARWRGHLDKLLPSPRKVRAVRHHPALPYAELPAFMAELRAREQGLSARALEFTILTAARTGETIGATWDEFDLKEKIWTVPAVRMKGGKDHKVPLCDPALEMLETLPRECGNKFVFAGTSKGAALSNMAMLELLKGMRLGFTVHGFRSTFRDWAAERTNYPREVVEAALAHTIENKVEAAYRRGDLFEKRRRLMRDWARYCASRPIENALSKVTLLNAAGA
jgi:integrase